MNGNPPSDPSVDFYNRDAVAYVRDTLNVEMSALYEPFLSLVRPAGHILDAGCGSGRDCRAFLASGYAVTAIDASPELARLASELVGQPVIVTRFQSLAFEGMFDGVWACASLLHVARSEIDDVLSRLTRALKPGGALFMSFKVGEEERTERGRLFNYYTEATLDALLARHSELNVVRTWRTRDRRPHREAEEWLNALALKNSSCELPT